MSRSDDYRKKKDEEDKKDQKKKERLSDKIRSILQKDRYKEELKKMGYPID